MTRAELRAEVESLIGRSDLSSDVDTKLDLCLENEILQVHAFRELMRIADITAYNYEDISSTADGTPTATLTVDDAIFTAAMKGRGIVFTLTGNTYEIITYTSSKIVVLSRTASGEADGDTVTLVEEFQALPSTCVDVVKARVIDDTSSYPIDIITKVEADELYPSPLDYPSGPIRECYQHDGRMYFLPVPSDDTTVRLWYTFLPTLAAADASDPTITTINNVLISYAAWRMFLQLEHLVSAEVHKTLFESALLKAVRGDKRKAGLNLRMKGSNLSSGNVPRNIAWQDPDDSTQIMSVPIDRGY